MIIDLKPYGGEGSVEIGVPGFRRYNEYRNMLGSKVRMKGREAVVDGLNQGDLDVLGVLLYVRSSPFEPTLEGWLAYCDALERRDPAASYRLFDAMKAAVAEVDEDPTGPFASSPAPATGRSG